MLGIALLLLSLVLYPTKYKKWSVLLFILFSMDFMRLLTEDVLGVKSVDLGFVYMIIINIYSYFYEREEFEEYIWINRLVFWMSLFLLFSVGFSYLYYGFTSYQILQGGRQLFLFLSYYFLRKSKPEEIEWIIDALFKITLVHALLYIIQVLTGWDVLFYGEASIDKITGVARYYNFPTLLPFFLSFCMLYTNYQGRRISILAIVILLVALFCTQGRTYIMTTIAVMLFGIALRGPASRVLYGTIILLICIIPFLDLLTMRFSNEGETSDDITSILDGSFKKDVVEGRQQQGTLSYRFAWVYERAIYLNERPLGEKCFGLGMISDSQIDVVYSRYHFFTGLLNEENDEPTQLSTPDISWGNILTKFGYLGGSFFLLIWIYSSIVVYKNRNLHPIILCGFVFICSLWLCSIADSNLSQSGFLAFPMLLVTYACHKEIEEETEDEEEDIEL